MLKRARVERGEESVGANKERGRVKGKPAKVEGNGREEEKRARIERGIEGPIEVKNGREGKGKKERGRGWRERRRAKRSEERMPRKKWRKQE